ncbi:Protein F35G2.2, partial [Aphelenchoides avenae]
WGHTITELQTLLKELNAVVLPKVNFSAYSVLKEHLAGGMKNVIVCGVAAHCCVFQTAMDLLEHGLGVHVVVNATTTYNAEDR